MASSTWPIPDSPPRAGSSSIPPTKPKAAWDTTGWVDGSTRNDKGKSSSNSWTTGRRNVNKNDSITGASKSDSWGSGDSSWGGGNKASGNDDDMDAAWSVQGGIKKPSANKARVGQVAGDDSTTSWGTPKDKPSPTQPSPISSDPRRNRQPPTGPAKRVERPKENITTPEISTKPSRWQSPPATVISAPVTPLISPVVFQRAPSMDRASVKKPVDVLDSVLAITRNREDYSPVQSEQSHGASNLDRHRLQYRKGIE
ncbi:hypothetical protein PQX77_003180 [Marasmius sp. AFHP31]|nr:hypothetical protein PQX77_003180 [Marasmius sp. AFHP31]